MALDITINFGKVEVSTGYNSTVTSVDLASGDGAKLPSTFSYNLVWWNFTDYADPSDDPNVEIVRVSGRSTDTLTIARAQESTSASAKNIAGKTYKMILSVTKKMMDDIDTTLIKADGTVALAGAWDLGGNTLTNIGSMTVDNLRLDGNTISSVNTNGNINLTPNGSGIVDIGNSVLVNSGLIINGAAIKRAITDNLVNVSGGTGLLTGASFTLTGEDRSSNAGRFQLLYGGKTDGSNAQTQGNFELALQKFGVANEIVLYADINANVGVGTNSIDAKLEIVSADAKAQPVLMLDQQDVSEEMMEFKTTTIGVGNAIEAVGVKSLTTTHFIKISLTGVGVRYIPCGTIA